MRPSSNSGDGFGFNGPSPSVPAPHGSSLALLNGIDPNGTWELYAFNDSEGGAGEIAGGWSLDLQVGGSDEVVFRDDFSRTDSGWDMFDESGTFGLYREGTYVLGVQGGFQVAWVPNTSRSELSDLDDVRVEATARFRGNADALAGVICRAAGPDTYFYFRIQGDGTPYIGENDADGASNFVSAFTPAVVRGEAPNRIAGECAGGSEGSHCGCSSTASRSTPWWTARTRSSPERSASGRSREPNPWRSRSTTTSCAARAEAPASDLRRRVRWLRDVW